MKKFLDKAKGFLAIGLTVALITTPRYVASASNSEVYVDDRPDYLQGNESEGVLCYDVATGEVTYTAETEINRYSEEMEYDLQSDDGECPTEFDSAEAEPQPYSAGTWVRKTNPQNDVNTRSTVKIVAHTRGGKVYSGTGFMVGSHTVATCGHLLCNYGFGEDGESWDWIEYAEIIPSYNSGSNPKPYGTAYSTQLLCGRQWAKDLNNEYDWGIIVLDRDLTTGYRVPWYQSGSYRNSTVTMNGYHMLDDMNTCTTFISESKTRTLYTGFAIVWGGDSGGPCYKEIDGEYKAIGIITSQAVDGGGTPTGTNLRRIDKTVYDELIYYKNYEI